MVSFVFGKIFIEKSGDIVTIKNLNFSFGIETIFENVNLQLPEGKKIGIVGVNGAGKTTFFRILLKQLEPDSGTITYSRKTRISWLPQVITDEIPSTDLTVFDYLLTGRPIAALEKKIQTCYEKASASEDRKEIDHLLNKVNQYQMELDYYQPYQAEEELLKLISGMHVSDEMLDQSLVTLSGGQKSKIAFLRLLYSMPEMILLDEPTNHLDQNTKEFVIDYLKKYDGTVFVISHDVDFLNAVSEETLYLDKRHHTMELFHGNYQQFERILKEREKRIEKEALLQEKERQHLQRIIDKYIRGNEKKANIAKDRQKKLAKLEEKAIVVEKKAKTASINLHQGRESTSFPLRIENLCFKYDKKAKRNLLYKINLEIPRGEKFLIVGENGVGKTTLLKLIVGLLTPDSGKVILGPKTDIGYYAQEHELIDFDKNLFDNFKSFDLSDQQIRGILGKFLFTEDDFYKKASVLSPGERSRLSLAKLTLQKANLLVLDEPTNHLDKETQQIMADNLKTFPGTIILVSHHSLFVDRLGVNRTLILPEGTLGYYEKETVLKYQRLNEKKK